MVNRDRSVTRLVDTSGTEFLGLIGGRETGKFVAKENGIGSHMYLLKWR